MVKFIQRLFGGYAIMYMDTQRTDAKSFQKAHRYVLPYNASHTLPAMYYI